MLETDANLAWEKAVTAAKPGEGDGREYVACMLGTSGLDPDASGIPS